MAGGEEKARSESLGGAPMWGIGGGPMAGGEEKVKTERLGGAPTGATATERGETLPFARSMPLDASDVDAVLQRAGEANKLAVVASFSSDNTHLLIDPPDATGEKDNERRGLRTELEALLHLLSTIPIFPRPVRLPSDGQIIAEEFDAYERWDFLMWRKNFVRLEHDYNLVLTPYEKSIDIWRQLWRVIQCSDLLVMVVDARDPLFYRCPDLEAYAKETDEHRKTMLLVNKADLLPLDIRKRWADYFQAHDILYVFWSAKAATAALEGKKLSGYSEEESASLDLDTKIYGRDELLMKLQAEAESIVDQRRTSTSVDDQEASSSDSVSSVAKQVVVGFVGYPNVGKSSTINALVGEKRTGVTHTPGNTKHFQTLIISDELTICDCPGLVFPSFSRSSGEMVAHGVLPITRMANYREAIQVVADRVPRDILEQIYKITLPKPYEPQSQPPTAAELLRAYCASYGVVSQAGELDEYKAAQLILKDYIDGEIPHFQVPPGTTDSEADWEQISCSPTTSANEMGTHQHEFFLPRFDETCENLPTPSCKTIDSCFETWKQLWKVLKTIDFLLLVVDARDPLLSSCPDLEAYAKETDEHRKTMLLVNKADLLPLNIRKRWADYFQAHDILYVFWSAKAATAALEGKKLSGYSEEESASLDLDTKIYGRDELLMKLQAEAESIVAKRRTSTSVDDQEASSSDSVSSVAKQVVVGFVGYPNVGKSSTLNALVGAEKATGVSHTPGKITLVLYDCPGHLLPMFSLSSYGLLLEEGISFEQLAIHKLCLAVNELLAGVKASREVNDSLGGMTRRLKILAEDIRVWLQSTSEIKVLIELYLKVAKGIAWLIGKNECAITQVSKLLKDMICDLETINRNLESKKNLSRKINGEWVKLFIGSYLPGFIEANLWIVKNLRLLLIYLSLWKGDSSPPLLVGAVEELKGHIQLYKTELNTIVKEWKEPQKKPSQVSIFPPKTNRISRSFDEIERYLNPESAPTDLNSGIFSSAEKKFHKVLRESRRQGTLKFLRTVNPSFKGKENIVSEEVDPKCMRCFESTGFYFNTCCNLILCRSCAAKRCLFCKQPHTPGENLFFPVIVRRPVLPPNPLQGG